MNIAVVGSRDFPYEEQVRRYMGRQLRPGIPVQYCIISGGARGVDSWAVDQAKKEGARTRVIPAEWDKHGRAAGFIRNAAIVDAADHVVIFWDGMSNGSKSVINHCHAMMTDYEVHFPNALA